MKILNDEIFPIFFFADYFHYNMHILIEFYANNNFYNHITYPSRRKKILKKISPFRIFKIVNFCHCVWTFGRPSTKSFFENFFFNFTPNFMKNNFYYHCDVQKSLFQCWNLGFKQKDVIFATNLYFEYVLKNFGKNEKDHFVGRTFSYKILS